jgi:hypothetical protein
MAEKRSRKHNRIPRRDVLLDRVVQFAECEIEHLVRFGQHTLLDLVMHGPAVVVSDATHDIASWRPSQFAQLQGTLRAFLRAVVGLADGDGGLVPEIAIGRLNFGVTALRQDLVVTVDGPAADVVLFQVVQLLQATGAGRLRRCAANDCAKVFAKTGRREFCSAGCQSRIYMRGVRKRERENSKRWRKHGKTSRQR